MLCKGWTGEAGRKLADGNRRKCFRLTRRVHYLRLISPFLPDRRRKKRIRTLPDSNWDTGVKYGQQRALGTGLF